MAPDKKDNKRKAAAAAAAADSPAKKTKKADAKQQPAEAATKDTPKSILKKNKQNGAAAEKKKPAAVPAAAATSPKVKADAEKPARQIKPRKRAADFLSDNESEPEVDAAPAKAESEKKKSANKKTKKEDGTAAPAAKAKPAAKKKSEPEPVAEDSDEESDAAVSEGSASEDEEDDRTAALIKGFESSGDEDESGDEGFDPSNPVPKIPDSKKAKRKILKKQREEKSGNAEGPGAVYVGRIPHGFYEHEMRAYFSQFGEITRLRLSRNRITGRSKHYAFVEFESVSVAKIVAATMDNYLMYGHILKCKYVPSEQLHPEIWKGANRRFKRTPWNRIEKKRLDKGKTRDQWTERIGREQERRLAKADKLKALGYEFDMPALKSVSEVPVQVPEEPKAVEAAEETPKAIEAPAAEETKAEEKKADDTPKKSNKKEKKGAAKQDTPKKDTPKKEEKAAPKKETAEAAAASPATKAGGKAKKAKKTKAKA